MKIGKTEQYIKVSLGDKTRNIQRLNSELLALWRLGQRCSMRCLYHEGAKDVLIGMVALNSCWVADFHTQSIVFVKEKHSTQVTVALSLCGVCPGHQQGNAFLTIPFSILVNGVVKWTTISEEDL